MVYNTNYSMASGIGQRPSKRAQSLRRTFPIRSTTAIERLLLMATIVLLPAQNHIPALGRFSVLFLIFGVLASYVLIRRSAALARTLMHPVFMTTYGWLVVSSLIEAAHPNASFSEPIRIMQMIIGGVFVASLCRDRPALRAAMYGYLIAGVLMSTYLFASLYSGLSGVTAEDFGEATQARSMAFSDNFLKEDFKHGGLSGLSYIAAQGTVVALVLVFTARSSRWRTLCLGLLLFCGVATFLPMSRGGIVMMALACGSVMYAYGVARIKTIMVAMIVGVGILLWVPNAVYSRLTFSTEAPRGRTEARARLLLASVEHLPEYVLTGVGAGNFWKEWGRKTEFFKPRTARKPGNLQGAHNIFIQVTIYWGLIGLLPLIAVIYQAYRCLPRRCGADPLSLYLLGIAISLLFLMLVTHVMAEKAFSLGLGLLVGAHSWIWPQGIVHPATQKHGRLRPIFRSLPARDGERRQFNCEV